MGNYATLGPQAQAEANSQIESYIKEIIGRESFAESISFRFQSEFEFEGVTLDTFHFSIEDGEITSLTADGEIDPSTLGLHKDARVRFNNREIKVSTDDLNADQKDAVDSLKDEMDAKKDELILKASVSLAEKCDKARSEAVEHCNFTIEGYPESEVELEGVLSKELGFALK
jgi:hypothetical protein